jgi:hypothetical protein
MSSLKEGALGELSPWEMSHVEVRWGRSQMWQVQPSEKKKWQFACGLFGMNNIKEGALWHIGPLLSNRFVNKHISTEVMEQCFLCSLYWDIISKTVSESQLSCVEWSYWRELVGGWLS